MDPPLNQFLRNAALESKCLSSPIHLAQLSLLFKAFKSEEEAGMIIFVLALIHAEVESVDKYKTMGESDGLARVWYAGWLFVHLNTQA